MTLKELNYRRDMTIIELTVKEVNQLWGDIAEQAELTGVMPEYGFKRAELWTYKGKTHIIIVTDRSKK